MVSLNPMDSENLTATGDDLFRNPDGTLTDKLNEIEGLIPGATDVLLEVYGKNSLDELVSEIETNDRSIKHKYAASPQGSIKEIGFIKLVVDDVLHQIELINNFNETNFT